jgi:hypothetical protein
MFFKVYPLQPTLAISKNVTRLFWSFSKTFAWKVLETATKSIRIISRLA